MSTFAQQLKYEQKCIPLADKYIKLRFGNKPFYRPTWKDNRELQEADVDVVVQSPELAVRAPGWSEYYISEKFRKKNWDDVLVEIYSNYEAGKPGWGLKTIAHEHWYYYSITTKHSRCEQIPTWAIRKAAQTFKEPLELVIKDMYETNNTVRKVSMFGYEVTIVLSPTTKNYKTEYHSVCIAIPAKYFEDINADIKQYEIPNPRQTCNLQENKSSNVE